jgi:hypothetical protein
VRAFEKGFSTDFSYEPPIKPEKDDNFAIRFIPASRGNSTHGHIIERDDVCKFFLPSLGIPYTFVNSEYDDIYISVIYFDDSEEVLLKGREVQENVKDIIETTMQGMYRLNPNIIIDNEFHLTCTKRYVPKSVGMLNANPVTFPLKPPSPHGEAGGPPSPDLPGGESGQG